MSRPVVLVTGPPCAGVTSLVAALAERMPDTAVVEVVERDEAVDAVVFAVSAVAPMAASDCLLLDRALAAVIGPVVAVVNKIDAHRGWRDVLAADRALLAAHDADRHDVPWVGVAASPDLGETDVESLVAALRHEVDDVDRFGRRHLCRLQHRRRQIVGEHRRERSSSALAVRGGVAQARVSLTHWVRGRCARTVADLRAEAATVSRSEAAAFETRVRDVIAAVAVEVDERIDRELDALADRGLVTLPACPAGLAVDLTEPVLTSRRVETQLMVVLGAGFGLGVALASGRLLSAWLEIVGPAIGALLGLAVTVWVVGVRGLLHTRAALDRWVVEVGVAARSSGEARAAVRLLAVEAALATASAEHEAASAAQRTAQIADIDAQIRGIMRRGTE